MIPNVYLAYFDHKLSDVKVISSSRVFISWKGQKPITRTKSSPVNLKPLHATIMKILRTQALFYK